MEPRLEFARMMARKYLKKHRVVAPPVPVEYLLFLEEIRVEKLAYPDATAGESWWEDGIGHIAVNPSLPPGRLRFTLAHEWGHLALRHHERRYGDLSPSPAALRNAEEAAWDSEDAIEAEANGFAAELLMPLSLFRQDWRKQPNPRRIARRYEVSEAAVFWRVRSAGLDGERC